MKKSVLLLAALMAVSTGTVSAQQFALKNKGTHVTEFAANIKNVNKVPSKLSFKTAIATKANSPLALKSGKQLKAEGTRPTFDGKTVGNSSLLDGTFNLGQMNAQGQGYNITTFRAGTYIPADIAAKFKGNKVKTFRTAIPESSSNRNVKVFIESAATGARLWEQTVSTVETTPVPSETSTDPLYPTIIEVPCDLTIDGSALVLGYEANVARGSSMIGVVMRPAFLNNAFLIDYPSNGRWTGWADYSSAFGTGFNFGAYFDLVTEGDAGLFANDVALSYLNPLRGKTGQEAGSDGLLINMGYKDLSSVSYKFSLTGDVENQFQATDSEGNPSSWPFLYQIYFNNIVTMPTESGRFYPEFTLSKVNGVADENPSDNTAKIVAVNIDGDKAAKRTVVVEEVTGLDCGWCSRGIVAMDRIASTYPAEDVIPIAVHHYFGTPGADPMMSSTYGQLPNVYGVSSMPSALLNRYTMVDPYYGSSSESQMVFSIADDIASIASTPAEAKITMATGFTDDSQSAIKVWAKADFGLKVDDPSKCYGFAYALVEDGVTGYKQLNYYNSAYGQFQANDATLPEDLRALTTAGEIEGNSVYYQPTFNHVARDIYDILGLAGSISSEAVAPGDSRSYTYTFNVPSSVVDKSKLKVVAMLIDKETGEITNAASADVKGVLTGINTAKVDEAGSVEVSGTNITVNADKAVATVFDANGRQVAQTSVSGSATISAAGLKGVYFVRVDNGSNVSVKKVIF